VSAIIPLYNKQSTIIRAVDSVLAQTEQSFELLIVDDGSSDHSFEKVRAIRDKRVRILRQKNAGPGAARNRGAAEAQATLLAFLDADDEWHEDFLSEGLAALSGSPQSVAYVCAYDAGEYKKERPNKLVSLGIVEAASFVPSALLKPGELKAYVDAIHSSCTIVRRDVFEALGGYFSEDRCLYGEDSFLWLGTLVAGPIYWDPSERVAFHVEDSVLGFAQKKRLVSRPISSHAERLRRSPLCKNGEILEKIIEAYVDMDLYLLSSSGAFGVARTLRKLHGRRQGLASVTDAARYVKNTLLAVNK
jgi:glycosyltransferase involved in cell wall biosynthesis